MSKHGGNLDLTNVLKKFNNDLLESQIIVAHNIDFDETIIGVESLRWLDHNIFDNYKNMRYLIIICLLTISLVFSQENTYTSRVINDFSAINTNLSLCDIKTIMLI